ncbi:MAG: YlbF family regulator [Paenibacillaceae bacterium]|jgi:cell fate (sporulation/competence/biofilm development) regulator YmcA (YheA/YmcA/DUF963 family)|nr:YlbF family regulator [Paenibacillaceae bacterium]
MEEVRSRDVLIASPIVALAKELADLLAQTEEVRVFREAERVIAAHKDIQAIIAQMKKKQKEIVAFEQTFSNPKMVEKIESEMADLEQQLQAFPIVTQFQQMQVDLNHTLQTIVNIIHETLSQKIALEPRDK